MIVGPIGPGQGRVSLTRLPGRPGGRSTPRKARRHFEAPRWPGGAFSVREWGARDRPSMGAVPRAGRSGENGSMTAAAPHDWDESYAGPLPPWDIGRPQPAFVRLADAGALAGAVLDAGCGTGEHTILATSNGARALGIDVARRAIETARAKAAKRGSAASFRVLDALRLATLGQVFDTIVDSGLFHVFDDGARGRYVTALKAVLRPGGHLHLMCFSDRQPGDWGPRRVTADELGAAFGSGWRIDSLTPDRFDLNPGLGILTAEAWLADIVRLAPE